jgi:ketosteroid isomerase-like protein
MEQTDALKQELVALETRYWNAIKAKDSRTAESLSDNPCIVVGAQGVGEIRRDALRVMLEQAPYQLNRFALDDVHIRQVSDDVFALAYTVTEDLTVDGEKLELKAFDSSVWKKTSDGWTCVVHTESLAGDPFGRH